MVITNCGFSEITKFCGNSKSIANVSALINRANSVIFSLWILSLNLEKKSRKP